MTPPTTGTREGWLKAPLELLEAEKELTRHSDELARQRQALPWVRIDKECRFRERTPLTGHVMARANRRGFP